MSRIYTVGFEMTSGANINATVLGMYQLENQFTGEGGSSYCPVAGSARTGDVAAQIHDLTYEHAGGTMRTTKTFSLNEYYIRFGINLVRTAYPGWTTVGNGYMFYIFKGTTPVFRLYAAAATPQEFRIQYYNFVSAGWSDLGHFDVTLGVWYCVEVHWLYAASGNITVKVDGVEIVNQDCDPATDGPTDPATLWWGGYRWTGENFGHVFEIDDISVNDVNGGNNNSWCGTSGVYLLRPASTGDRDELYTAGSPGWTENYQTVNELPPDDTYYVFNYAQGEKDLYGVAAQEVVNGLVNCVVLHMRAQAILSGNVDISRVLKTNSEEDTEFMAQVTAAQMTNITETLNVNPVTDDDWTLEEVNALQIGPKIG